MENKFLKVIASKSNEELLEILNSKQDYQPEFIEEVKILLEDRNIEIKSDEKLLDVLRTQNPYFPQYSLIREELIKRGRENDILKIESEIKSSMVSKTGTKEQIEKQKKEKRDGALQFKIIVISILVFVIWFLYSVQPTNNPNAETEQEQVKSVAPIDNSNNSTTEEPKPEKEKVELSEEAKRQYNIDRQFSAWDGSHNEVEKYIKKGMNNPDSYENVETSYSDKKKYLIVLTTYRGTNSFNAIVTEQMKVRVNLDNEGNPVSLREINP
ncbi:MAG: hypothetical protein V4511_04240 [Bacteroidota bacterium]